MSVNLLLVYKTRLVNHKVYNADKITLNEDIKFKKILYSNIEQSNKNSPIKLLVPGNAILDNEKYK